MELNIHMITNTFGAFSVKIIFPIETIKCIRYKTIV